MEAVGIKIGVAATAHRVFAASVAQTAILRIPWRPGEPILMIDR